MCLKEKHITATEDNLGPGTKTTGTPLELDISPFVQAPVSSPITPTATVNNVTNTKNNGPAFQVQDGNTNGMTRMTPLTDQDGETVLTCEQFNCHGFKQSSDYVYRRLQQCDILCLTETWLKPAELPIIQETIRKYSPILGKNCMVFSKSGMENTDHSYTGRPYGGLCIIVKKTHRYSARLIESPSDRIVTV